MNHIAIMKKSWKLIPEILSGRKTIETRWYKNKSAPWDKIHSGDTVFFKDSGSPVTAKAEVSAVEQYSDLDSDKINEIMARVSLRDLGALEIPEQINEYIQGKKYCIIIHLKNPQKVDPPFDFDKTGYGAMAAWICGIILTDGL